VIAAVLAIVAIAGGQALSASRSGETPAPVAAPGTPSGTDVVVPGEAPTTAPADDTTDSAVQPTAEPSTPTGTAPTSAAQNGPVPQEPDAIGSAWGPKKGLYISWVAPLDGPRPERYEVTVRWNDSKTTIKTKNAETSLPGLRITKDCTIEIVSIIGSKRSTIVSARCGT
jgi:hypothetical protein